MSQCRLCEDDIEQMDLINCLLETKADPDDPDEPVDWLQGKRLIEEELDIDLTLTSLKTHTQNHIEIVREADDD